MPKESKKKQATVSTITLDTGWFSYQILRDTQIAHIIGCNVDPYSTHSQKMWPALLTQMELITRKEGFVQLLHHDYITHETAKHFLDKGWTALSTQEAYDKRAATFVLFKDISKEPLSKLSLSTLYGDDLKKEVKKIVEESHLPQAKNIDKELEPVGLPNVNRQVRRDFIEDDFAPAEPVEFREGQPIRPIDPTINPQFWNNTIPGMRWNAANDRIRRAAAGPENPVQVPRGITADRVVIDDFQPVGAFEQARREEEVNRIRRRMADLAANPPVFVDPGWNVPNDGN